MNMQITHLVVEDTPPPDHVMTVGYLYPVGPDTVFKTQVPDYAPNFVADEEEDEKGIDEAETKVVRRGRRPQPQATEGAETK